MALGDSCVVLFRWLMRRAAARQRAAGCLQLGAGVAVPAAAGGAQCASALPQTPPPMAPPACPCSGGERRRGPARSNAGCVRLGVESLLLQLPGGPILECTALPS